MFYFRDGIMFAVVNSGTSLYAGFTVFAVLGFMAKTQGIPIDKVAVSGGYQRETNVYKTVYTLYRDMNIFQLLI